MHDRRPNEASPLAHLTPQIRVATNLQQKDLLDLVGGEVGLVVVRAFLPSSRCAAIAARLSSQLAPQPGPDVYYQRLGEPFGEAAWNPERLASYQREEADFAAKLDFVFAGGVNPFDALSMELCEIWPWGVWPARWGGISLKPGVIRAFLNGGHAMPHTDRHPFTDVVSQIAANVFVEMSELGGEVQLWTRSETTDTTSPPDIVFLPQSGDLVLFRASCVHAVSAVAAGRRTTVSAFIGWRGPKAPVYVWG
jgi:hypothetical protein